jgi:histidinol-phosphate aminotransferase
MRTVSKMGLAGLRLGYLAGPREWIEQVDKVRLPYNINALTQASAALALRHRTLFDAQTAAIRAERARLFSALASLDGVEAYPSQANFILMRLTDTQADKVFEGLRGRGVLVKNLHGAHPLLAECLRVTVGRPEEHAAFLAALAALIQRPDRR